jgi:type III secretory pathway component EscU
MRLHPPLFKQQMGAMLKMKNDLKGMDFPKFQRQIKDMTVELNDPEFKQQMATLQKEFQSGELQRRMEEASRMLKDAQAQFGNTQIK